MDKMNKSNKIYSKVVFSGLLVVAVAVAGCSTPTPKKVDTSRIPIYTKTQAPGEGSLWAGETSMNTPVISLPSLSRRRLVPVRRPRHLQSARPMSVPV